MEANMLCDPLILLCKNRILSEKGAGMHSFKNWVSYDRVFENLKRAKGCF